MTVSAREADSIFQKVDKINRDVEVMERVEKLERQNRKIVILGSMFMTLVIMVLGVSTFLMFQANLFNQGIFLNAWQRVNHSQPSSGEAAVRVTVPQSPKPIAEVPDPKPAEPTAQVSDPQPVATPTVPKPAETTSPGKYVGFIASNKYHYPGCGGREVSRKRFSPRRKPGFKAFDSCYIFGIQPKMNYNRYGVNIIPIIPSPLVGEE